MAREKRFSRVHTTEPLSVVGLLIMYMKNL